MKHMKRHFNWSNSIHLAKNFSLRERFNMMITVVTCFFTKMLQGDKAVLQLVRGLAVGQAMIMKERCGIVGGEVRQGCKFVTGYRNAAGEAESLNGEQLVKAKGKILDTVVGRQGKECNRIRDGNKIRAGNRIRAGNKIRAGNEIRAENRIAGV